MSSDAYLDSFERKLCASIRRAGVEDVLSPAGVHSIVARFRKRSGDIVTASSIDEMTALEEGPSLRN